MEGLAAQRFSLLPMTTFGNATTALTPCYNSDHLAAGIHNSTGCKGSSLPVFVSLPHFQGSVANWPKFRGISQKSHTNINGRSTTHFTKI
jgi:hypothetical protein